MLVVSNQLHAATQADALENWVRLIVPQVAARFPQCAQEAGIGGVEQTCREIERFSSKFDFEAEESFWQVIAARVANPALLKDLTEFQIFALSRKHASQKLRLQRFLEDKACRLRTVRVRLNASFEEGS